MNKLPILLDPNGKSSKVDRQFKAIMLLMQRFVGSFNRLEQKMTVFEGGDFAEFLTILQQNLEKINEELKEIDSRLAPIEEYVKSRTPIPVSEEEKP